MSRVSKSDKIKPKNPETQVLSSDAKPEKRVPVKKQVPSKISAHLKGKSPAGDEKERNKTKLTNAANKTAKNVKVSELRTPQQSRTIGSSQENKLGSRNASKSLQEQHASLRAKQVSKPSTVLRKTNQKETTARKTDPSTTDKKAKAQKKNSVLDTPHNVTVSSPPSKRKNDLNKAKQANTDEKRGSSNLIRKGSRTLAPDEIVILKRESAKLRSEETISRESSQVQRTETSVIKEPIAFEVNFEDNGKKERPVGRDKLLAVDGKDGSNEEINYSDDFDSYESDFETDSSNSSQSTSSTPSASSLECRDVENPDVSDHFSQITSDGSEAIDGKSQVTQRSLIEIQTDKERKLDSGNYDTTSRKISTSPDQIIKSNQPYTDGWTTLSLGISEQMDSGISTSPNFIPTLYNKSNVDATFCGYKYFYEKPIITPRGSELKTKIQFDVLSFTLIDLKPISYDIFMQTFGKINTNQNFTQTHDNHMTVQLQTDMQETRSIWTQHPPRFVLETAKSFDKIGQYNPLCCGDMTDANESGDRHQPHCELEQTLVAMKKLHSESSKHEYQHFQRPQRRPLNYENLNSFLLRSSLLIDQVLGSSNTNMKNKPIPNTKYENDKILKRICAKSFYMETNFLNTLRVIKLFSNNKFNLLITVHESLPDTNVYRSDFLNLLMVWCTNTCEKPLRLLTTWSEVSKVEIPNDNSDIVVAALRDGSIALWDLRETHSFCSKLDGYLTHFPATQSIIPSFSVEKNNLKLEMDLGACLDVKSFKSLASNVLQQTTFPKTQFVSLHDSGLVTVWTLIETSGINLNATQAEKNEKLKASASDTQIIDSISPWARIKLMQSTAVNIKEHLEGRVRHSESRFDKTKAFFQKNIYSDESLKELNEVASEVGQQGLRFTSLECGSENIFICTNRNFILMCSKTLKMDKLKRIFIDESQFLFPTALKVLNNENFLAIGLSNGIVMILNCQSNKVAKNNMEQPKKTVYSRSTQSTDFSLNSTPTSKSCAIQNILLNVEKTYENMDLSRDYRPSTAACISLIDSKKKPFELNIFDQQIIMSGSVLRKNLIQSLELSADGWYLFALADGHIRVYDFYLEQELPNEESQPARKVTSIATGRCGFKENTLIILRPNTDVEVHLLNKQ